MHHTGPCSRKSTILLSYFILAQKWKGKKYHVSKNQQVTLPVLSNMTLPGKWEDTNWGWWRLFRSILFWWPGRGGESLLLPIILPREGGLRNASFPAARPWSFLLEAFVQVYHQGDGYCGCLERILAFSPHRQFLAQQGLVRSYKEAHSWWLPGFLVRFY